MFNKEYPWLILLMIEASLFKRPYAFITANIWTQRRFIHRSFKKNIKSQESGSFISFEVYTTSYMQLYDTRQAFREMHMFAYDEACALKNY